MKKIITSTALALALALVIGVGSSNAQPGHMMRGGHHMYDNDDQQWPCTMMGPGMMWGRGMGMMGPGMGMMGYGMGMGGAWRNWDNPDQYKKFMSDTKDMRRKLYDMRFDYQEATLNPKTTMGDLQQMREKMYNLQREIMEKMRQDK